MPLHAINEDELEPQIRDFYCRSLKILIEAQIPFLVGGAYAFDRYTAIGRNTKDLDLFVRPNDCPHVLELFSKSGYETEITAPHWLAKAFCGENFVDIIFTSGNGYGAVDDLWFQYAPEEEVLGIPVRICPVEEMLCSKAFVMARDRYDGADVAHLLLNCAETLDWQRLLNRFGSYWRVLLSHLILFGFIYPTQRSRIPSWVMNELFQRLQQEATASPETEKVCQGTLLSPLQYEVDVEQWGYQDGRRDMTADQISHWTAHLKAYKEASC